MKTPPATAPVPAPKLTARPGNATSTFVVVGIGASAGGLEALEKFIKPVPAHSGMAFVVLQHLEPTGPSLLVDLLQRHTPLPVAEVVDGTVVEVDHVYVLPPDKEVSILNGVLLVMEPAEKRGHRQPIDVFLHALADDRGAAAVGVILSGMGADGSVGLRAVKQRGGATFAQAPESSEFDSMPRAAIATGAVDVVAKPEMLYEEIQKRVRRDPHAAPPLTEDEESSEDLNTVILLVRTKTGHDFSHYKRSTLMRRIERRMQAHHLTTLAAYTDVLRNDPQEADVLFNTLLIGVTQFFRDPAAWEELARTALPALLAAHPGGGTLRAWVPGCSTGEEAYSLAIVFREALETAKTGKDYSFQIFATDLDSHAIATAREAQYPLTIASDVSAERLRRFFVSDNRGYRVTKTIRESVIFAPQNLVMDPPFTKLDLISCRNLLIYLTPDLQKKLFQLFHYGLRPHGLLFLGSAETTGATSALFSPLVKTSRIFRREDIAVTLTDLNFPTHFGRATAGASDAARTVDSESTYRNLMERVILQRFAPAALLVQADGTILYVRGDVERVFDAPAIRSNPAYLTSAGTALARALLGGLKTAAEEKRSVVLDDLLVESGDATLSVRVAIAPMDATIAPPDSYLVALSDVSPAAATDPKTARWTDGATRMAREVDSLGRELDRARLETEHSQQELRATNEELQSTNEELTSSKEEMQSMNEELQTVNHELQAKLDELTLASNDMTNLLNSTSIATLFLDAELHVRRFTIPTTSIIRLIPGDVGRPITDLVSALDFPDMASVAREVLHSLVVFERTVAATGDRWFTVRIMPYRTHDDRIDGLVFTFTDATKAKTLETALRAAQRELEERLASRTDATRAPHNGGTK